MKKIVTIAGVLILSITIFSCSPVKIVNTWNGNGPLPINDRNVLVVTKVDDKVQRVQFETDLAQHLKTLNVNASESFKVFPEMNLSEALNEDELKVVKEDIKKEDIDLVILTSLKSVETYEQTNTSGGANYHMYGHPWFNRGYGFYGYYNSFYVHSTPISSVTSKNKKYILETVTYDLTLPDSKQLISVITTEIDNPDTLGATSKVFSKRISQKIVS